MPDRPIPNPDAIRDDGDDGWTLLVNPDTAGAIAVNGTGALVWSLVNGKRTTEDIIQAVKNRYPNAPDAVRDDVLGYMTKLAEEGFIGEEMSLPRAGRRRRFWGKTNSKHQATRRETRGLTGG